jgi:hypothetical protein
MSAENENILTREQDRYKIGEFAAERVDTALKDILRELLDSYA